MLNFGKRYEDDIRVIFDQLKKLHLGLDALSNQTILNIYLYIYFFSYLDQIRHCIIFHRIGEGDSGVYSCQAVNPLGEAVCEAEFQIVPGEGIFKIFISSFLLKKYTIIIFFDNKKLRWRRRRRWPLHSRKMENRK